MALLGQRLFSLGNGSDGRGDQLPTVAIASVHIEEPQVEVELVRACVAAKARPATHQTDVPQYAKVEVGRTEFGEPDRAGAVASQDRFAVLRLTGGVALPSPTATPVGHTTQFYYNIRRLPAPGGSCAALAALNPDSVGNRSIPVVRVVVSERRLVSDLVDARKAGDRSVRPGRKATGEGRR